MDCPHPIKSILPRFYPRGRQEPGLVSRAWYFTVSGFVLLSQLSQATVGKLSIFIVRSLLEINA